MPIQVVEGFSPGARGHGQQHFLVNVCWDEADVTISHQGEGTRFPFRRSEGMAESIERIVLIETSHSSTTTGQPRLGQSRRRC
jgi:hypothetical protein